MPVAAIAYALISAALFGASTPLAKLLLGELPPLLLAGLLYLSSGLGLLAWIALRPAANRAVLARSEWPWLGAAIVTGGVIAPALLMFGLVRTDGARASCCREQVQSRQPPWWAFSAMASASRSSSSRCAGSAPHAHRRTFPSRLSLEPQSPSRC